MSKLRRDVAELTDTIDELGAKLDEQGRVSRRRFFVSSAIGVTSVVIGVTTNKPQPAQDIEVTAGGRHSTRGRASSDGFSNGSARAKRLHAVAAGPVQFSFNVSQPTVGMARQRRRFPRFPRRPMQ